MAAVLTGNTADAPAAIDTALHTDVVDVFRSRIPELGRLSRQRAYDIILDNPVVLDGCIKILRRRPTFFRHLMVDPDQRPVTTDTQRLTCGRTLAEIVTLLVRMAARRHFRNQLGRRPAAPAGGPAEAPRPGLLARLRGFFKRGRKRTGPAEAALSPADQLYRAIQDYLRFEWQVPLIPYYAVIPVRLVSRLGARLLDLREPHQITTLLEVEAPEQAAAANVATYHTGTTLEVPRSLFRGDGGGLDAEVLWRQTRTMSIAALFPGRRDEEIRRNAEQIAAIGGRALQELLQVLAYDVRRLAVFLFVVHHRMGDDKFRAVFGERADPQLLRAAVTLMRDNSASDPGAFAMKEVGETVARALAPQLSGATPPPPRPARPEPRTVALAGSGDDVAVLLPPAALKLAPPKMGRAG